MKFLSRILGAAPMSDEEAFAALQSAVLQDSAQQIEKLLGQHPSLLERSDEKGMRPLHWAAKAQALSSVGCLVDLGADVTQKEAMGYTPEGLAHWYGEYRMGAYTDVCQMIVDRLRKGPLPQKPNQSSQPTSLTRRG